MIDQTLNDKRQLLGQLGFSSEFLDALEHYNPDVVTFQQQEFTDLTLSSNDIFSQDMTIISSEDYASTNMLVMLD